MANRLQHFLARLLFGAERRSNEYAYQWLTGLRGNDGSGGSWDYETNALLGYKTNPVVYACLSEIMTAASSIKLGLSVNGEVADMSALPASLQPLGKLIKRPNPNQAQDEFIEKLFLHWHLSGCAYILGIGTGTETYGQYTRTKTAPELYCLRPDRVKCEHRGSMLTGYKYREEDGTERAYTPEQVLTIRFAHPDDDFKGLSPLASVERTVLAQNKSIIWNANLFDNSAIPPNAIEIEGLEKLDKNERERIRQEFVAEWGGAKNAGKSIVKGVGMKITPLAPPPKDLDWLNGDVNQMRKIAAAMGVPSHLIGDTQQGTYANYAEARKAFYTETIMPRMEHVVGELNWWLAPQYGEGVEITLGYDHIDALRDDKVVKVATRKNSDWLSVNEQRVEDGLEPYGDPDDPANEANIPRALRAQQSNPFAGIDMSAASIRERLEPLPFPGASTGH